MHYRLYIITLLATLIGALDTQATTPADRDRLLDAIMQWESRGNDFAIGDKHLSEKAYGAFQIRQPCVDDINARYGTSIQASQLLGDRALSRWVCQKYLELYATRRQIGREPTMQDMARVWNGGPTGWKKSSTVAYWAHIKEILDGKERPLAKSTAATKKKKLKQ